MSKIFLGIGSGAVQLGLWGYYAHQAGFKVVLIRVDDQKIAHIYDNNQSYWINIAGKKTIKPVNIGPVEMYNINKPEDQKIIIDYISKANDIVTAVPSTADYSPVVDKLLRAGLKNRQLPVAIFASENEVGSANTLAKLIFPQGSSTGINFSESVIGRMGGFHDNPELIKKLKLKTVTPFDSQALLVEEFDEIIINDVNTADFTTCFDGFIKTDDILMYEELKLFGHNAVHFLLGCLAKLQGYRYMSEIGPDKKLMKIGREALINETGGWFLKKYRESGEPITKKDNFDRWANELINRIVNPNLYDSSDRVIRNPQRKLRWDDRIIGITRRCLENGIIPKNYALGVAAALIHTYPDLNNNARLSQLQELWGENNDFTKVDDIIELIFSALLKLR